jgi:hypothetical protein
MLALNPREKVLRILCYVFTKGATREELIQHTRLSADELDDAVDSLRSSKEILRVNAWLTDRRDLEDHILVWVTLNQIEERKMFMGVKYVNR